MELKRNLAVQLNQKTENKKIESDCYVEGYASTFDTYELCKDSKGSPIYERFERTAFDNTDMSDTIMQFDHEGPVFARVSNGSLTLSVDDGGLHVAADLSRTARGRELYDDIQAGNVTSMSLRCTVDSDFDYDNSTHIVKRVKKLYDVSAVSIPANDFTSIVARKQGMENDIEQMKNKKTKDMIELMIMLER